MFRVGQILYSEHRHGHLAGGVFLQLFHFLRLVVWRFGVLVILWFGVGWWCGGLVWVG